MAAAAVVHRSSFDHTYPWLFGLHSPEEDKHFYTEILFDSCDIWGGFCNECMVGLIAFREGWVEQLYVLPSFKGLGFGRSLLRQAQFENAQLRLWTFQKNVDARRFYERNGFLELTTSDGLFNEEKEPDVLYEWRRYIAVSSSKV